MQQATTLPQLQAEIERRAARPATMSEVAEAALSGHPVKLYTSNGYGAAGKQSRMTFALDETTLLVFARPPERGEGGENLRPYLLQTPCPINPKDVRAEHRGSHWVIKSSNNTIFWLAWARFWEGTRPLGEYCLTTGPMYLPVVLEGVDTRYVWFADQSQNFLILRRGFDFRGRPSRGTVVWIDEWTHINFGPRTVTHRTEEVKITHNGQDYIVSIPYDLDDSFDQLLANQAVVSPKGAPVVQVVGAFDCLRPK